MSQISVTCLARQMHNAIFEASIRVYKLGEECVRKIELYIWMLIQRKV